MITAGALQVIRKDNLDLRQALLEETIKMILNDYECCSRFVFEARTLDLTTTPGVKLSVMLEHPQSYYLEKTIRKNSQFKTVDLSYSDKLYLLNNKDAWLKRLTPLGYGFKKYKGEWYIVWDLTQMPDKILKEVNEESGDVKDGISLEKEIK